MQCTQRALARRCDRNLGLSRQQRSSRATVDLKAVAAAVPHGVGQHQTEMASAVDAQDGPLDHGLEAFKSLIAERRFFCTQCGKCCTGDGEVWITDEEAERIAAHLGLSLQRFCLQYTRAYSKVQGFKLLRAQNNPTRDCIFLQPDNTCSIHKVRPLQCSTYPWWPDLMNDYDWAWEKENICEGFDYPDAPPTDTTEAAKQLREATAMEYRRMLARKPSKKQQKAAAAAAAAAWPSTPAGPSTPPAAAAQSMHTAGSSQGSSSTVSSGHRQTMQDDFSQLPRPLSSASSTSVECGADTSRRDEPGPEASGSKHTAGKRDWQQRLSRLQELQAESDNVEGL